MCIHCEATALPRQPNPAAVHHPRPALRLGTTRNVPSGAWNTRRHRMHPSAAVPPAAPPVPLAACAENPPSLCCAVHIGQGPAHAPLRPRCGAGLAMPVHGLFHFVPGPALRRAAPAIAAAWKNPPPHACCGLKALQYPCSGPAKPKCRPPTLPDARIVVGCEKRRTQVVQALRRASYPDRTLVLGNKPLATVVHGSELRRQAGR